MLKFIKAKNMALGVESYIGTAKQVFVCPSHANKSRQKTLFNTCMSSWYFTKTPTQRGDVQGKIIFKGSIGKFAYSVKLHLQSKQGFGAESAIALHASFMYCVGSDKFFRIQSSCALITLI